MTRTADPAARLVNIDNDTALVVLEVALNQCAAIRRDMGWTQSDDAAKRHEFSLRDIERNIIPRIIDPGMALVVRGAVRGAREAFAA